MSTATTVLVIAVCASSLIVAGCRSTGEPSRSAPVVSAAQVERASRVVAFAMAQVGAPYRWGGSDPRGFDCSGLVMYVYGRAGVSLPHGALKQYRLGTPVSRKELAPGDIVFFDRLNHSGIYIGDGRFVHATKTGDTVKISRLNEAWFERRWVGARRPPIADRQSRSDD
jgi:cell wall-associated NlpC family hydrolase